MDKYSFFSELEIVSHVCCLLYATSSNRIVPTMMDRYPNIYFVDFRR